MLGEGAADLDGLVGVVGVVMEVDSSSATHPYDGQLGLASAA